MILGPFYGEWWVERGRHTPVILFLFSFIFVMTNKSSQQPESSCTWECRRKRGRCWKDTVNVPFSLLFINSLNDASLQPQNTSLQEPSWGLGGVQTAASFSHSSDPQADTSWEHLSFPTARGQLHASLAGGGSGQLFIDILC